MFFIGLIILTAIGFVVQYILGILQIKNFSKNYTALRKNGRVTIGRRPSIFKAGTLVLIQINRKNIIEEARYMQGVTVFNKFKSLKGLENYNIEKISDEDLQQYNKLLIKAIMDAKHTFNVIDSGGEIQRVPSPLMKVIYKVNNIFKQEGRIS